jgi:hypothetical protein
MDPPPIDPGMPNDSFRYFLLDPKTFPVLNFEVQGSEKLP